MDDTDSSSSFDMHKPRAKRRRGCDAHNTNILSNLFETGSFSDLTILCDGKSWNVHKAVVCEMSPVIKREVEDSRWEEGQEGVVKHDEFKQEEMSSMIEYFYYTDYLVDQCLTDKVLARLHIDECHAVEDKTVRLGVQTAGDDEQHIPDVIDLTDDMQEDLDAATANAAATTADIHGDNNEVRTDYGHRCEPGKPVVLTLSRLTAPIIAELVHHIKVHALADFYEVRGLQELATNKASDLLRRCSLSLPSTLWPQLIKVHDEMITKRTAIGDAIARYMAIHLNHIQSAKAWRPTVLDSSLSHTLSTETLIASSLQNQSVLESISKSLEASQWGLLGGSDDAYQEDDYKVFDHLIDVQGLVCEQLKQLRGVCKDLLQLANRPHRGCPTCRQVISGNSRRSDDIRWSVCDENTLHCNRCEPHCPSMDCNKAAVRDQMSRLRKRSAEGRSGL